MSFGQRPLVSTRGKVGCFGLATILAVLNLWLLAGAAMGHCAPNADGTGCEDDALVRWLMFPGFLFVSLAILAFAAWLVVKRRD